MKLADRTKTSSVALKKEDAKVCLKWMETACRSLAKRHYSYPPTPYDKFSAKVATTNKATVIFTENKNQLGHKSSKNLKYTYTKDGII